MSLVQQPEWINTVTYVPLLRYSVLASLLSEYVPDGVGISPTTLHTTKLHTAQLLEKPAEDGKTAQNGALAGLLDVWCGVVWRVCVCVWCVRVFGKVGEIEMTIVCCFLCMLVT